MNEKSRGKAESDLLTFQQSMNNLPMGLADEGFFCQNNISIWKRIHILKQILLTHLLPVRPGAGVLFFECGSNGQSFHFVQHHLRNRDDDQHAPKFGDCGNNDSGMAREHGWYLRFLAGEDFIIFYFMHVFVKIDHAKVQVKTEHVASIAVQGTQHTRPCWLAMFAQHVLAFTLV